MALMNKPDESIFASSAKQGEVDNFPDLLRGWGITFDQTQGIPPMEWFNFLFKRMDEKHAYLMQRGLPEWSATQDYAKGSCVQFDGLSYRALKAGKNNKPNESDSQYWVRWGFTLAEIARATLTQYGLTQLYTGYDSQREDLALTPKTAYQLKQLINSNTRSLGNFIPNSKKSSRVDSNSAEDVATSVAVKTAYDKGVEAKDAADNANQNAEGRVSKSGDTITGKLRINAVNTSSWSALEMGTNQGKWTLEVNPHSHEAGQRRFNVFYDGGGKRTYLAFPHVGDNGDTVAYQSWVEGSYLPLTGGKITGNLEIDRGNDYAGVILHNKSKIAIIESTPDSENQFLNLIYRTRDNQNVNVVKVPKKTGTLALLEDIKNVHRRDYNRTINGTSNWDNGKSKTITLTGSVTIYPDGRIVQILHLKNFRIMWFDAESPTVGYANLGYRHPLIKLPLWSAMPNKILSAMPQMVRTTHPTTSTTYVAEAGEWISAWAIREQGNDKGNVYINTRRFTGDADEIVDLYVVIEGY